MMSKPLVAIIGRPNVGKSTFFNKMAGKRISIMDDMPGVTRDRIYADVEWLGHDLTLIDTGGLIPGVKTRCSARCVSRLRLPWTRRM